MEAHPPPAALLMDPSRAGMSPATKDFLAGAVAGALSIATTQPLDTVRVRMQSAHFAQAQAAAMTGQAGAVAGLPKKAPSQILACMVQKEGSLAPFRGMMFPLACASLQGALIFQVYGTTLRFLSHPQDSSPSLGSSSSSNSSSSSSHSSSHSSVSSTAHDRLPTLGQGFIAGSVAGLAQSFLSSPVEMLKIRMQLQTARPGSPDYVGPSRVLWRVLTTEGVTGLYRGLTVTALRDLPSYGVYFAAYHGLAQALEPGVSPERASALTQILAGGTSGCLAWISIYPLDVIKNRMQSAGRSSTNPSSQSWLHYARAIYSEGGTAALWRGIQPTLARAFVMDAVSFLGYTYMLKLMRDV